MVQIFTSTLGASASSIDTGVAGIPSGHGDLIIVGMLRSDEATNFSNGGITFNGDTAAHYDYNYFQTVQTTVTGGLGAAAASAQVTTAGTSEAAGVFTSVYVVIPAYSLSTVQKVGSMSSGHVDTTAANCYSRHTSFNWRSTAAITQLAFTAAAAKNYIAGSKITIYGTQ